MDVCHLLIEVPISVVRVPSCWIYTYKNLTCAHVEILNWNFESPFSAMLVIYWWKCQISIVGVSSCWTHQQFVSNKSSSVAFYSACSLIMFLSVLKLLPKSDIFHLWCRKTHLLVEGDALLSKLHNFKLWISQRCDFMLWWPVMLEVDSDTICTQTIQNTGFSWNLML